MFFQCFTVSSLRQAVCEGGNLTSQLALLSVAKKTSQIFHFNSAILARKRPL